MRVVLADDHRVVREGLRWMLGQHDDISVVGEASDGEELLEFLAGQEVDVVLLDLRMPGLGGLETLERLQAQFPSVRVVVLTMHDEPGYVRRAIELGAAGYLLKNAGEDELVQALSAVMEGHAYLQGEITRSFLDDVAGRGAPGPQSSLSPRELEVLQLVADGLENKQIARRLGVSEATVKTYLKSVFTALGVNGRAEAAAMGLRLGIIE